MAKKIVGVAALGLVLSMSGFAYAQTVVNITASVGQTCVAINNGSFHFNITDPAVATPATSVVQPLVQCTNGAVATITAASANQPGAPLPCAVGSGFGGLLNEAAPGSAQIFYLFTCGTGSITGTGIEPANPAFDVSVPIDGTVGAGEANSAPQGNYSDTVTLTFSL